MKTKFVCPWNLRPGQKLVTLDIGNQRTVSTIKSIEKRFGNYTGRHYWRVTTDDPFWPMTNFHQASKNGSLKLQKAEIVVE